MDNICTSLAKSTARKVMKRLHYPLEVMGQYERWYAAYPLSFGHQEEHSGVVDHATVHR